MALVPLRSKKLPLSPWALIWSIGVGYAAIAIAIAWSQHSYMTLILHIAVERAVFSRARDGFSTGIIVSQRTPTVRVPVAECFHVAKSCCLVDVCDQLRDCVLCT